ncbi:MAG TPA: glycoside hydrolase family 25 protein [Terracidiphilus sp.]|nr:glycoside hydrolase family 25 protein [Terracidiphilus sp.]
MPVTGTNAVVDISHFQGSPDFDRVAAAGIVGVIHKATDGITWSDPNFAANRDAINAAGLFFGSYHFGRQEDGAAQAANFLKVASPQPGDLLVLDFEQPPHAEPAMTTDQARAFVQAVQAATGVFPGLYGSPAFLTASVGTTPDPVLGNCWLWIAQYKASISSPTVPTAWPAWTLWQYTNGVVGSQPMSVDGIAAGCDRDTFNGTSDQLASFWEINSVPEPATDSN